MTEKQYDSGTQALIDDLLTKPQSFARDEILARARKLRYHDFKGTYDMPQVTLVKHMTDAGYKDLAKHVVDGKYDQPASESAEWAKSPEGREVIGSMTDETKAAMSQLLERASERYRSTINSAAKAAIDESVPLTPEKKSS